MARITKTFKQRKNAVRSKPKSNIPTIKKPSKPRAKTASTKKPTPKKSTPKKTRTKKA